MIRGLLGFVAFCDLDFLEFSVCYDVIVDGVFGGFGGMFVGGLCGISLVVCGFLLMVVV